MLRYAYGFLLEDISFQHNIFRNHFYANAITIACILHQEALEIASELPQCTNYSLVINWHVACNRRLGIIGMLAIGPFMFVGVLLIHDSNVNVDPDVVWLNVCCSHVWSACWTLHWFYWWHAFLCNNKTVIMLLWWICIRSLEINIFLLKRSYYDAMIILFVVKKDLLKYNLACRLRCSWMLGSCLAILFCVQMFRGIVLSLHFSMEQTFHLINYFIEVDVIIGWLMRLFHMNS